MSKHISSVKTYFSIYVALMVCLAVTLVTSYIDLGALNTPINLGIAALKAVLVVLFFMHVKYDRPLTRVFVVVGLFWLGILFTLTIVDYVSRGWVGLPGPWPPAH